MLEKAMEWMEKRVPIIDIENGRKTQRFESWNADSFYFYDASENLAEFIVRHDLKNNIKSDFSISNVLCVNEIGMPTNNVEKLNNELKEYFGTKFWKGDIKRFGTNGSQEGMFLLPNYELKEIWFPTYIKLKPVPFQIQIENNEKIFDLEYKDENIITTANRVDGSAPRN